MHYNSKITGMVIRELREKKGWTQEVMSGLAGISRTHLIGIEKGHKKPNVETLWKISNALDIALSELFRMVEERSICAVK